MAKRVNRTDLTLRNLHSLKKRLDRLERIVALLAAKVKR